MTQDHSVYWGSHGCALGRGHSGQCACDCCELPDEHDGETAPSHDGDGVLCVAYPPYYGADTKFWGDDVKDGKPV